MSWILEILHRLWSTEIHLPPWSVAYPWYHLLSSPGPKNAQCPSLNFDAYSLIFLEVRAQESSLFFFDRTMSLNNVMKIHRSLKFSGVMCFPCRSAWNLWRMSNAVALGKIFHSKSIGSPSNPCNYLKVMTHLQSWHLIIPLFDCFFWTVHFPKRNTESEWTYTLACFWRNTDSPQSELATSAVSTFIFSEFPSIIIHVIQKKPLMLSNSEFLNNSKLFS